MTDARYTGLCIEGPMAGQYLTHYARWYSVSEYHHIPAFRLDPVPHPNRITETVKKFTYKHVIGFRYLKDGKWTEDVLNFWIPEDKDWSPIDCVRRMAEDYANYHDLRNS